MRRPPELNPPYLQILQRFGDAWRVPLAHVLIAGAVVFAVVFTLWPRRFIAKKIGTRIPTAFFALCVLGAAVWSLRGAWDLRWVSDDAYISFRYARNLATGHGLVFNPGERVEGYTNFIWTLMVALALKFGADAGQASIVLSLASFFGALLVSQLLARRMAPEGARVVFPLTAMVLGLNYTFSSFATSGLETMFSAFAMIAAVERADAGSPLFAGFLGIAAVLSHPDHAVLYAVLGAVLLLDKERRRTVVRYGIPFVTVYVPYFIWRYHYYGDWFPNTYYAKSGGDLYFSQGSIYLLISGLAAGTWAVLPLAVIGGIYNRRSVLARFALVGVPAYLVYIAKIGGDFMLGRLFCTVMPPLAVLAELGVRQLLASRRRVMGHVFALAGAILLCASIVHIELVHAGEKFLNVADERTFYEVASFSPMRIASPSTSMAEGLNRHFSAKHVAPVVAIGCVGIVGYETNLPIIDTYGLTDRGVAHTPILRRGRPGHEKSASAGYLMSRNADVWDRSFYPDPYAADTKFKLGGDEYWLARYDPALVRALRATHASGAAPMPTKIDQYLSNTAPRDPDVEACDLWFFDEYYFKANPDPLRWSRVLSKMTADGVLPVGGEPFLETAPGEGPAGFSVVQRFGFDKNDGSFVASGAAFANWPNTAPTLGQDMPYWVKGGYLDTWTLELEDAALGKLESSRPFLIDGDFLTVQIGGGRDRDRLAVNLIVDGAVVASATGCNTELTGRRIFDVTPFRKRMGSIEIADQSAGGWGHIIVDDVTLWARR